MSAFLPLATVIGFLFAVNVFMDAQTLTESQKSTAEFSDTVAHVTLFEAELVPGSPTGDALREAAHQADPRVTMEIGAIDFPFYAGGARGIFYREKNWQTSAPETRYSLGHGRWPTAPGEVAVIGERDVVTEVGDQIATLGGGESLTVVGVGQPRWEGGPIMLAAPGTWAGLKSQGKDHKLVGFPTFALADGRPEDLVEVVQETLRSANLAAANDSGSDRFDISAIEPRLRTRADAAAETARPWSERSPLSLYVPGLTLAPTALLIGYLVLSRRLAVTGRRLVAQGVRTRDAVVGLWLVPIPTIVILTVGSAITGSAIGWGLADLGVGRWGYHVANWRLPLSAGILGGAGVAGSLLAAWVLVRVTVGSNRGLRSAWVMEKAQRLGPTRQVAAGFGACACLWIALTMKSTEESFVLTGAATLTVALLTPELVRVLTIVMPERTLSQRLVSRQITHQQTRVAAAATGYIAVVAITLGMLVALASYRMDLHSRHPAGPPPGQLLVDNDGVTFLGVEPGVRSALDTVPALRSKDPVQLFLIGDRVVDKSGVELSRHSVGTADFPAVSFAFESVDDVQVAYGRTLTDSERDMLVDGGALVPRPDRVAISDGQIELVDVKTMSSVARVSALEAEPVPTPWSETPAVTLTRTVEQIGLPLTPAALLYQGVSAEQADAAERALLARGYSPRTINKHERPPAVAPAAAIVGSALSLVLLVVVMSVLVTRTQVQSMRAWAAQLTRLGVPSRWATGSLVMQYLWILGTCLPLALVTVLISLGITRLKLPDLVITIPWLQVAGVLSAVVVATLAGALLAARRLNSSGGASEG